MVGEDENVPLSPAEQIQAQVEADTARRNMNWRRSMDAISAQHQPVGAPRPKPTLAVSNDETPEPPHAA